MIDEVNAQARELYSLGAVAREAQISGNIKTIVKVGYAPVQEQMIDLRRYFVGKGLEPEKIAIDRMKINGITIKVVNASKRNWVEGIKGCSNFIKV